MSQHETHFCSGLLMSQLRISLFWDCSCFCDICQSGWRLDDWLEPCAQN